MTDQVSVDPNSIRQAGSQFSTASGDLDAALSRLRGALNGLGDVCGDDDQGRQFAAAYDPNHKTIDQALLNMARGLGDIATALDAMASNYEGSDRASTVRGPQ